MGSQGWLDKIDERFQKEHNSFKLDTNNTFLYYSVIMKNSDRIERIKNRRQKILMSDWESEYNDTDNYETDDEVHLKKRIINEAPPPYSS